MFDRVEWAAFPWVALPVIDDGANDRRPHAMAAAIKNSGYYAKLIRRSTAVLGEQIDISLPVQSAFQEARAQPNKGGRVRRSVQKSLS